MPSRMIREGVLDSDKYARISDAARLLFFHLMLLADDFGCVSVSAAFLRRRCFYDSPSDERIARLICELVDVDLIRTYEVDRACFAFIPRFRQRLYLSKLKHPMPAESLYSDDVDAVEKFNRFKKDGVKTPVVPPGLPRATPVVPPLEVEVKRTKQPEPDGSLDAVWQDGVALLKTSRMGEATARSFIGMLCKRHFTPDVADAIQAAMGSANPKGYILKILESKPLKGASASRATFD